MDPKIFARVAAIALLAGTLVNAVVIFGGTRPDPASRSGDSDRPLDPLRGELARCKALGDAAIKDSGCGDAWAKNRARFFHLARPNEDRKIDLFPARDQVMVPASNSSIAPNNPSAALQWTAAPSGPSR